MECTYIIDKEAKTVKHIPLALCLLMAPPLFAQVPPATIEAIPDCRQPNLEVGHVCSYSGTNLPLQKNLGQITFSPPDQTARVTSPLGSNPVAPVVKKRSYPITIGGFYTDQTQDGFSYKAYNADGFKLYVDYGLGRYLSVEARGTVIRYSVAEIGHYSGKNHTFAATVGPRIQYPLKRFTPYFTPQLGGVHQQYYGLNLGAAAGVNLSLLKHFSWNIIDAEFRSDQFDPSYRNQRKSRQELATGLAYRF